MSNFDRLRPRSGGAVAPSVKAAVNGSAPRTDREGKQALFSADPTPSAPARGALRLTCSACGAVSPLTPRQALAAAVPSLHLPILRRKYPSWMRCPACRRHQWVRVDVR